MWRILVGRRGTLVPYAAPGRATRRSPLRRGEGLFGCGVWVCILFCLLGFGSAMEGPGLGFRMTMASTPMITHRQRPAVSPLMPWETCLCRGRPWVGQSVLHQRSTAERDGIRLKAVMGDRSPPIGTAVEPRRGSEALIPVTPGRKISPANQCGRHRRPKKGSTDSAGAPEGACRLEQMDLPSPG